MKKIKIAPSFLSADFSKAGVEMEQITLNLDEVESYIQKRIQF